jgi:uncharacterized repeat protein (TIGR04138 family)
MKQPTDIYQKIDAILVRNRAFKREAYYFVLAALDFTLSKLEKPRHVTGRELLDGVRQFGQEQFGLLCLPVFSHWGITETEHFGQIVFSLVESGLLSKNEEDSLDDFKGIFDLQEALGVTPSFSVDKNRIKNFLHHRN